MTNQHPDSDLRKGAIESDERNPPQVGEDAGGETSNTSMSGQMGHRSEETQHGGIADGEDTDFPEPGQRPEHSGQSH